MSPSISLFDLTPGKKIEDRFEIKRAYRQGGMSATFEVTEGDATRELQVFPAGLFESPAQAKEFGETLAHWKSIHSSAVLHVHEVVVKDDGALLLVTDFPHGDSLRSWLKEHERMECPAAIRLGLQILDGLVEVHESDLVHGDIKPYAIHFENGKESEAMLLDGGITSGLWNAKQLGEKTALIGTPVYAPAEQFGGEAPEVQSDIYNLATVLFELVTGTVPWPGTSFLEVFQSKLDKSAPSMSRSAPDVEVPAEVEKAIVGGLLTDKRERYRSAVEFRDALRRVAE